MHGCELRTTKREYPWYCRPAVKAIALSTERRVAGRRKRVEFYVAEHNLKIPRAPLRGKTPDEMYFGGGAA